MHYLNKFRRVFGLTYGRFWAAQVGILSLLAALTGCATAQPGQGVTADFATAMGCDVEEVRQRAADVKLGLSAGRTYIPQVGWDACEMLARVGKPTSIDRQQVGDQRSMSWWYTTDTKARLVTLDFDVTRLKSIVGAGYSGCPWVVSYVGW